jgi:hypothetical protein
MERWEEVSERRFECDGKFADASGKFKPIRLNAARFDQSWDRKRGSAMRLTSVLLREDDAEVERRVCENERAAKT